MNILLVMAHPRRDSFTGKMADAFVSGAVSAGHQVEFADLYAENFDPILREEDEPYWDRGRQYSTVVEQEMNRIRRNDATVMVFPVWWWSLPAMMKGWIDRVWNHGFAYAFADGLDSYPHEHALMIGVAGTDKTSYQKRDYDRSVNTQLDIGILDYCSIKNHGLALFYDTLGEQPGLFDSYLQQATEIGASFPDFSQLPA